MKNNIIFLTFLVCTSFVSAQRISEKELPNAVKEAFAKKFPGTKVEHWQKENVNYEAEFDFEKAEMSASFDEKGNCLETETEIKISELPPAVKTYLDKNMPGKKIKEASKISDAAGKITYEAEVGHIDFIFDAQGSYLSQEDNKE